MNHVDLLDTNLNPILNSSREWQCLNLRMDIGKTHAQKNFGICAKIILINLGSIIKIFGKGGDLSSQEL